MSDTPLVITAQEAPVVARPFKRWHKDDENNGNPPSTLLNSIRAALRGSAATSDNGVHTSIFIDELQGVEEELSWDDHTITWSHGGVQRRQWRLADEGQSIRWACIGRLRVPDSTPSIFRQGPPSPQDTSSKAHEEIFGPFFRINQTNGKTYSDAVIYPGIFVFLRSIGKIFLLNGFEYTFSLPFIIRKAWPLYPHSVLIQRVLDKREQAQSAGDSILPTVFTISSPFAEPRPLAIADSIVGGCIHHPPSLKTGDGLSKRHKPLPANEYVIYVAPRLAVGQDDILVTVNTEKRCLSVWVYVNIPANDVPPPSRRHRAAPLHRKNTSLSAPLGPMPTEAAQDLAGRADRMKAPALDGSEEIEATQPVDPVITPFPSMPEVAPDLPPASDLAAFGLGATDLGGGKDTAGKDRNDIHLSALGLKPADRLIRRESLTRNDLSFNMNKMVLGQPEDEEPAFSAFERVEPDFWVQKLLEHALPEAEGSDRYILILCLELLSLSSKFCK